MNWDYATKVSALSDDDRVSFYELLAHALTICTRAVWSNESLTDAEKVQRMKALNEIQHRVISKIRITRRNPAEWPEDQFKRVFEGNVAIAGDVGWAIETAYRKICARSD